MIFGKIKKKRIRLNQLNHRYNCSIIGTCLTLNELRKLGRKAKLANLNQIGEYDLHRIYVGIAEETSYANRSLQKFLDQKYQKVVKQFLRAKDEVELKAQWNKALKTGDIAASYWMLVTHPISTEALLNEIYGDVHMLSHVSGASMRVDLHEFSLLRHEHKALKKQQQQTYQKHNRTLYEKNALLGKQDKQIEKQQQEINALKVALMREPNDNDNDSDIAEAKTQLDIVNNKILYLEKKVTNYQLKWKGVIRQKKQVEDQFSQANKELKIVESLLKEHLLAQQRKHCESYKSCSARDLKGQCILYVGGRDRQCRHFRTLVENNNGEFIHHDGGLSHGSSKLDSTLVKADAVMCPLDCISHEAMIKVKKHCQFSKKPLIMMPHSSLSAFGKGLSDLG